MAYPMLATLGDKASQVGKIEGLRGRLIRVHLTGSDEVGGLRPARPFVSPTVDELAAQLIDLRSQNELLSQIAEQAIRIGDTMLERACEAVSAYREYEACKAAPNTEAAALASHRLAAAVDDLSPVADSAMPPEGRTASATDRVTNHALNA
jgi:hypothetical protein